MSDNILGRKLLASGRRINPLIAAASPHDPVLAERVGHILLDDCEALVAAVDAEDLTGLSPAARVERLTEQIATLELALYQLDDARTLVDVARAEARQ